MPDLRRAAMEYIDARAASHIDDLTSSERSKQVIMILYSDFGDDDMVTVVVVAAVCW